MSTTAANDYIEKLRSIATPIKKRGSPGYFRGATRENAVEAAREVAARKGSHRADYERAALACAVGAGSQMKAAEAFQEALIAGHKEFTKLPDGVRVDVKDTGKTAGEADTGNTKGGEPT